MREKNVLTPRKLGQKKQYFATTLNSANVVDRRRFPQPLSSVVARYLSKTYEFNVIDFEQDGYKGSRTISVNEPGEIIVWDIKGNRDVYLDLTSLIGFSEGCKIGRKISFRMSSMIFGRFLFRSITGPGRIYFTTAASPIVSDSDKPSPIMHPSSLIAWSSNAKFTIEAALTKTDVFLSGYRIRKSNRKTQLALYDTDEKRVSKRNGGILRFVKTFLLPF